jgi:hypothetical protein
METRGEVPLGRYLAFDTRHSLRLEKIKLLVLAREVKEERERCVVLRCSGAQLVQVRRHRRRVSLGSKGAPCLPGR